MPRATRCWQRRRQRLAHPRLAVALVAHRGELRGRTPERARDLCSLFQGLVNAAVARGEVPGPALRRRVARAVLAYLQGPAGR